MKKALVAALALIAFAAPASAVEFDGGALQIEGQYPLGQATQTGTAVLTPDYSNVTNFLGSGYANGGATLQGANTITRLVADDCTFTGVHAGSDITQFVFSVVNFNTATVTVRPRVRFWFADGAAGAPGTYYNLPAAVGFSFLPVTVGGSSITLLTASIGTGLFTMPAGTMWAGITFDDNNGTTGISAAQLNNIGQGIFHPATVGSSADGFFQTAAAGSFFSVANPAGSLLDLGGSPVASFGWEFSADVPVPVKDATWGRVKSLYSK